MFLSPDKVEDSLKDLEAFLGLSVDNEDGNAVAERLAELNGWYTYASRLVASAEFHKRKNKKDDAIWCMAILADKLSSACSYQIRSLITILSALKEDRRIHSLNGRNVI
ncbi:hypothetical protein GCM10028806_33460 [Spirosoma terrae]|uniref:Uncharacterized protein n=1 Tax=Spirosoma terrae TaxID=1968276 RepID=A0A6L9L956_9BACT|nr:hypothetical protein [Spirosoma terrae]NDU95661.1 hypothetical protein [Spirosoma terrae]